MVWVVGGGIMGFVTSFMVCSCLEVLQVVGRSVK